MSLMIVSANTMEFNKFNEYNKFNKLLVYKVIDELS